jgi:hypothetical protein
MNLSDGLELLSILDLSLYLALSTTLDLSAFLELSTLTNYFIGQLGGAI